jgi:hypothetical protein
MDKWGVVLAPQIHMQSFNIPPSLPPPLCHAFSLSSPYQVREKVTKLANELATQWRESVTHLPSDIRPSDLGELLAELWGAK